MLKPVGEHVFLERLDCDVQTDSGILLKTTKLMCPNEGRVVAIGPGITLENGQHITPEVEVGDIVYYPQYKDDEIEVDGKEYRVIKASMILGIK